MISIKVEDRQEVASNFIPSKSRVLLLLEENDLLQLVKAKSQNQKLKKTNLVGERMMPKQERF